MDASRKKELKAQWRDRQQTPDEWYQCLHAGTEAVRRPYELPQFRRVGVPSLVIYHIPSFQDCHGWFVSRARGACRLHTIVWRQVADGQRVPIAAQPTLEDSTADIDVQWFEQQLAALSAIRIPLVTERLLGCDGESYGVHIPHSFEVEWWCDGPAEWAELTRWSYACIEYFRHTSAA